MCAHLPALLLSKGILEAAGGDARIQEQQAVVKVVAWGGSALNAHNGARMALMLKVQRKAICNTRGSGYCSASYTIVTLQDVGSNTRSGPAGIKTI